MEKPTIKIIKTNF